MPIEAACPVDRFFYFIVCYFITWKASQTP
jgi:hypothetical protein